MLSAPLFPEISSEKVASLRYWQKLVVWHGTSDGINNSVHAPLGDMDGGLLVGAMWGSKRLGAVGDALLDFWVGVCCSTFWDYQAAVKIVLGEELFRLCACHYFDIR